MLLWVQQLLRMLMSLLSALDCPVRWNCWTLLKILATLPSSLFSACTGGSLLLLLLFDVLEGSACMFTSSSFSYKSSIIMVLLFTASYVVRLFLFWYISLLLLLLLCNLNIVNNSIDNSREQHCDVCGADCWCNWYKQSNIIRSMSICW